ncbi:MAG: hypothetical protein CBC05_04350 [Crocinitomicaceae bacterium TMED45]|nr:MAG: hypothetical protein CBC05_04350 [Crocinitomicaceae bacterium TMED45]
MLQTLNRFTGTALVLVLTATIATAQIPCVDGNAGGYPCQNIDLMGYLSSDEVGGGDMNDIWGWIDPSDGTEYAILGRSTGTSFIDISDPANPIMVANLPTNMVTSFWRDIKVHDNHAFIVSEASGHGMQVVDLTQLGSIENPPQDIEADALYTGWGNAHNIVINESTGRAYGVGTATFAGGLHILDISDPLNPTLIGDYAGDGYTHDAQVVSYIGPDGNYQGKEIAFCCNENTVTIVDVTDPTDATMISSVGYAGSSYTHQGWLTEDHRYFMSNDELDEQDYGVNTTTFIWDVSDLSDPQLIGTFVSETSAIDHNMYVLDTLVYQSNYRAGLRVLDLTDIENGELDEVAYFDVYPSSDAAQFNGSWSNYPYLPSGVIPVSHIEEGVFFLKLSDTFIDYGCTDAQACNYDPDATEDDGSCLAFNVCGECEGEDLFCVGCMDETACNYTLEATIDDGSCFSIDAPAAQSASQSGGPVTFTAEPASFWFETETSIEPVAISDTYTLPLLTEDGSVWVAHSNAEYDVVGGKAAPDFENGQHHPNNAYCLVFDVFQTVLFESVEVYSEEGGFHTLEIADNVGTVVVTATQNLTAGQNVFDLGVTLEAGEGYQIRSGNEAPFLWRDDNEADVAFPYDLGSLASITGTTIEGENEFTYYYFYYNWTMSSAEPCLSERTEFTVTVDDVEGVESLVARRNLVRMVDVAGREITAPRNQLAFLLYDDGSVEKRFFGERQ